MKLSFKSIIDVLTKILTERLGNESCDQILLHRTAQNEPSHVNHVTKTLIPSVEDPGSSFICVQTLTEFNQINR